MKQCKSCLKKIDEKAKKCAYCQTDQRSWIAKHPILTVLGVLLFAPFVIGQMISISSQSTGGSTTAPTSTNGGVFNAKVHFDGTQFIISNAEAHDCENAKLEINGGLFKGGYSLDGYTLEAGNEYTVGAGQFADNDGNRFNPLNTKPQNFNIFCRGTNEISNSNWYGEF